MSDGNVHSIRLCTAKTLHHFGWMDECVCVGESGLASSYYDYVKKFDEYNIYGL